MTLLPEIETALLDAIDRDQHSRRSAARTRRRPGWPRAATAPLAIGLSVVVALAVGAIVVVESGRRHHESSQSPVQPTVASVSSSRQALMDALSIMRRPQTTADLNPRFLTAPFKQQEMFLRQHRPIPPLFTRHFASGGNAVLDSKLVRVMALPGGRYLAFTPSSYQPAGERSRTEGLELEYAYHLVGNSLNITAGPEQRPTSVAQFLQHGIAVGDLTRQGRVATGMLVVPDGVARVELTSVRSARLGPGGPLINTAAGAFGGDTLDVHNNIATYRFRIPTVHDRQLVSAKDGVTAIAKATWLSSSGRVISHTTTELGVVVDIQGHPRPTPNPAATNRQFCAQNPQACPKASRPRTAVNSTTAPTTAAPP